MSARLSVLMSVFNGGPYLKEAVESALASTLSGLEFVVVDNVSTDGSRDYLRGVDDPRLRLIENEKNLGQTGALNVGLRACGAPIIARLDADDLALPGRFEKQLSRLEADPGLALIGGQAIRIDQTGKTIGHTRLPTVWEEIRWRMTLQNCFVHSSVAFQRDAALEAGLYPADFRVSQDFALFSAFLRAGYKLENLPEPVCALRSHDDQVMATGGRQEEALETARVAAFNQGWALDREPDLAAAKALTRLWYGDGGLDPDPTEPPAKRAIENYFAALPAEARTKARLAMLLFGGPCGGSLGLRLGLLGRALRTHPAISFSGEFYIRLARAAAPGRTLDRLRKLVRPANA